MHEIIVNVLCLTVCILMSWYHQCWILAVQFNIDTAYSNHGETWALFDTQCIVLSWGCSGYHMIISLWPGDAIWRQKRSGSTLALVMACCLTAPSRHLNQCWQIINEVQWHSHQGTFTREASTINHENLSENYISKISFKLPSGQRVKLHLTRGCIW